MVAVTDRSIVVRAEQLPVAVSIEAQAAAVVVRQALQVRSIAAIAQETTATASATITATHTAATRHHLRAEVTPVATLAVATTLVVHTVAVRAEDNYKQEEL